jgi:hypothetical protein
MNRKCAICAIACVLGAVLLTGVVRLWPVPRVHPVTMTWKSVNLTHDSYPMAEFVVTNAGFKPVYLDIGWRSDFPSNIVLPLSFFRTWTHCRITTRWAVCSRGSRWLSQKGCICHRLFS